MSAALEWGEKGELPPLPRLAPKRSVAVGTVLDHHFNWHDGPNPNGPGGTIGPGSGYDFLLMHREMIRAVEARIGGNFRMPEWDGSSPIPPELIDPALDPERAALLQEVFPALYGEGVPTRNSPIGTFEIPGWATVDGGSSVTIPADLPEGHPYYDLRGRTYDSLDDFSSPDELGRVLGAFYHGEGHNAVGGVMNNFASPTDPIFYVWHGHIDAVLQRWIDETPAGRQWAADNSGDPILNPTGDHNSH